MIKLFASHKPSDILFKKNYHLFHYELIELSVNKEAARSEIILFCQRSFSSTLDLL